MKYGQNCEKEFQQPKREILIKGQTIITQLY